ncbi:MAG: alpha/beta hydrolase family protein [Sedimentisphaerales bacterium]|nr:alpha/beta hydrolase family protein [Sedimentisphaerales bacterium]
MGFAERVELIENDAPHNYNVIQRQSVVRWMARWLLNKDEPIQEPTIELLSEKEIQCTPQGQVMLLEAARSSYDLNRDFERELAERRRNLWKNREQKELLHKVREMAGIHKLAELPEPTVEQLGVIQRDGYQIEKVILEPEEGIYLPALLFVPELTSPQGTVLYVHENGKSADASPGGPIEELVKSGRLVLAVDLRGTGETHNSDAKDAFTAYLLGRSYVGMRAEDILVCARFLQQKQKKPADLIAVGHVGIPALHAAALEPDLFASVRLVRALTCWSKIIESGVSGNQMVNTVHGALTLYDLPDLAASLGDKLTVEQPLDAMREAANKGGV